MVYMLALFSSFVRWLRLFRVRALRLKLPEVFLAEFVNVLVLGLSFGGYLLRLFQLLPDFIVFGKREQAFPGLREIFPDASVNERFQGIPHPSGSSRATTTPIDAATYTASRTAQFGSSSSDSFHALHSASARLLRQALKVPGVLSASMRCYSSAAQNGGCS